MPLAAASPLWFTTRGLGLVLLMNVTAVVVLGIVTGRRWRGREWPRFLTAGLHRNLALLAVTLLGVHVLAAILDPFAQLGLKDVAVPFAAAYRPLWLGLGVLGGELLLALVAISLLRPHLGARTWRATHWAAYAAWPMALLHGIGTGSDTRFAFALAIYIGCAGAVLVAVLVRLSAGSPETGPTRLTLSVAVLVAALAVAVFTLAGPLQPGWAAAAGTPKRLLAGRGTAAAPQVRPLASEATPARGRDRASS